MVQRINSGRGKNPGPVYYTGMERGDSMTINYVKKLPTVEEIYEKYPLSAELERVKRERDGEIARVFTREDNRFLMIIGPCSAHNVDAVCDYVSHLAALQEKVKDRVILVPRIYTNKPRTLGTGYKGMLHQPDHQKKSDMAAGLIAIRQMHIRALSESHLPAADEMLYPGNYPYLADVLSYVAIGARSVENQEHRLTVSGLDIPVGMKNPTDGGLKVMLDSIFAAHNSHEFAYNGWAVRTTGNPFAHAVLRGSVDREGNHIPNYHYEDLMKLARLYKERHFPNPFIVVDTNHSNSGKKYHEQVRIAREVMLNRRHSAVLRDMVRGFMVESYLVEGAQEPTGNEYGKSITDPCLGWEDSEKLVLEIADLV